MKIKIDSCNTCMFLKKNNFGNFDYCTQQSYPIESTMFDHNAFVKDTSIVQEWCPVNGYYEVTRCRECPNITGVYITFSNVEIICKLSRKKLNNYDVIQDDCPLKEVV